MEIDSESKDPGVKVHVQSVETASTGLRAASSSRDQLNLSEASTSATPSQIHETKEQEVPKSVDVLPSTDAKKDEIQAVPALPTSVTHPSNPNPTSSAPLGITGNYLAQVLKNLGKDPREKQRSLAEVLQADRIAPLLQSSSVKHRLAALQEFLPAENQDEFSSDVRPFPLLPWHNLLAHPSSFPYNALDHSPCAAVCRQSRSFSQTFRLLSLADLSHFLEARELKAICKLKTYSPHSCWQILDALNHWIQVCTAEKQQPDLHTSSLVFTTATQC